MASLTVWLLRGARVLGVGLLLGVGTAGAAPIVPRLPESAVLAPRGDGFLARVGKTVQHWRTGPLRVVGEHEASDMAWRPDGGAFVLLDDKGVVKLVDVSRPTVEETIATPQPRVHAIAGFLPDGRRVLLATSDWQSDRNAVVELDLTTKQSRLRLAFRKEPPLAVPSPAKLDPTGHWLATQRLDLSPHALQVWSLDTDQVIDLACQNGSKLAWSRDGSRLAADCSGNLRVFGVADRFASSKVHLMPESGEPRFSAQGDRVWRLPDPKAKSTRSQIANASEPHATPEYAEGLLDWSGDRRLVVRAQRLEIQSQDGSGAGRVEAAGVSVPVTMTPLDGGLVAVQGAGTETIALLDLAKGVVIETLSPRVEQPSFVTLPDGKTLLALSDARPMIKLPSGVDAGRVIAVSPDGRWLIASLVDGTAAYDLTKQTSTRVPLGDVTTAVWSPKSDGVIVQNASRAIIWRVGKPEAPIAIPLSHELVATWTPSGAAIASDAGKLWWWQADKSGTTAVPRLRRPVTPSDGAPPTRRLVTVAKDGTIVVTSCGNRDFDETQSWTLKGGKVGLKSLGNAKRAICLPRALDAAGEAKWQVKVDGGRLTLTREGRTIDVYGVDEKGTGALSLWLFEKGERIKSF